MKKLVFFLLSALMAGALQAQVVSLRHRAVTQPVTRLEILTPAQVGLSYGADNSQKYILTAKSDGTLWRQIYAPYALGNVMPAQMLDVSSSPAELVLRYSDRVVGIRFFPKDDTAYPGYIVPFDPLNFSSSVVDSFTPGSTVDGVLMDCPIQGLPNTDQVVSITAYNHLKSYLVVEPRVYLMDSASFSSAPNGAFDSEDGYPMVLFDHYQDGNGAWYVLASQCLRDAQGSIITSNPPQRKCPVFR